MSTSPAPSVGSRSERALDRPSPRHRRSALAAIAAAALAFGTLPAVANADVAEAVPLDYTVTSPDGSLAAHIGVVDGRLTYSVVRDAATTIVSDSGLGFVLAEPTADLTSGMEIVDVESRTIDETWTPSWGTTSTVRNHANELVVSTVQASSGIELDVTFRVFDDGVGFRYSFPEQEALPEPFIVTDEVTQFGLPADVTAHYINAGTNWSADEQHYKTQPITSVATAQTPFTLSRADGLFIALHEADLTDYASMTLARDGGATGLLMSELVGLPGGNKAVIDAANGGFDTPWRTLTIGRDAGDLAESHLVQNLNDPCAICDVDSDGDGVDDTAEWIQPGTYTGVWWELQRRATTWFAGPQHGATTERTKEYIDLAASAGSKYVLAEGWNVNAGGNWTNQDFLTPMADFDLPEVLSYAESKGVSFVGHNETRGYVDYYEENLEEIFSQYAEWGIHSIKTGYATRFDLGGVGRSHFDQEAVRHYQRVIDMAAKYEIAINAHEAIKPTGKERTYPNMMTGEGVAGMEQQNYMGSNGNPPAQATILPFTRWIGGPADYTPGVLNVTWDPARLGTRVQTTTTAQLALYTTFYSPLQMLADTPENYALHPESFEYLKNMPTTWDDSRVDAEIGDHVVTARRSGDVWYTGVIVDEVDRSIDVPLDFLDDGREYVADIYTDAADASWKGNPQSVEVVHTIVTADDVVTANVVGGGGQAMKIRPATAEESGTLPALAEAQIEISGELAAEYDRESNTVSVSVPVTNAGSIVSSTELSLYVDGIAVATQATRIGGSASADLRFTFPYEIPARERHTLAVGDASGPTGDEVGLTLAPYFGADEVEALVAIANSDAVTDPSISSGVAQSARAAAALSTRGDYVRMLEVLQSFRADIVLAPASAVSASAREGIDEIVSEFLGQPEGVLAALAGIAELETALDDEATANLREAGRQAVSAAEQGRRGVFTAAVSAMIAHLPEGSNPRVDEVRDMLEFLSSPVRIEAEAATRVGSAAVSTEHPGFSGSGFVKGLTSLGAGIVATHESDQPRSYDVAVRYANGMVIAPLDRQLTLEVNDDSAGTVAFANRGQDAARWRNWGTAPAPRITTAEGTNSIALVYRAGDSGNVNVDYVDLLPATGMRENTRFEAEKAVVTAATVDATVPDFTGEGYVTNLGTDGASVQFEVTIPAAGLYNIAVNHSADGDSSATVVVNSAQHTIALPQSGTTWRSDAVPVELAAGANSVVVSADAGVRLDSIALVASSRDVVATPSAPTAATARPGDASADVSWSAPTNDGGAPIDSYWVTPQAGDIALDPVEVEGSELQTTVTGLDNGSSYVFTVAAENSAGLGAQSEPSNAVVPTDVDSLAPEVSLSISEAGTGGWYRDGASATLTADDGASGSGIESIEFRVDSGDWQLYEQPVGFVEGSTLFEFRATDGAGNVSEVASETVRVDATAPSAWGWLSTDGDVVSLSRDAGSSVARAEYAVPGGDWIAGLSAFVDAHGAADEVRYRVVDEAGNASDEVTLVGRDAPATVTVAAGEQLLVQASGFEPNSRVRIELHSAPTVLATVTADSLGVISARVTVPAGFPSGAHTLVFVAVDSGEGVIVVPVELPATGATWGTGLALAALVLAAGVVMLVLRRRATGRATI